LASIGENNNIIDSGRKSLSIGWRLSLHVAGIGTILCLTVVLSLLPFQYGRVEQEAITEARILSEAISAIYQRLGDNEPLDHARRLLMQVARTPHISLVNVNDKFGFVRYSTDSRELGKQYAIRYGVLREENVLTLTHVVSESDSGIGSVLVVIDRDQMLADTNRLFAQVAISLFAVIFILSLVVKGLVDRLVSARLSRLLNFMENAETGSFLVRAEVDCNDEIGQVITGFNRLLGVITARDARHLENELNLEDAQAQKAMRVKLEETLFQLERSNERLNRKVQAQELLMEAAHRLGGTLERDAIVKRLIELIEEKLSWPVGIVFLMESSKEKAILELAATLGINQEEIRPHTRIVIGEGIAGIVAQTGSPMIVQNLEKEQNLILWKTFDSSLKPSDLAVFGSLMAVPMIHKGRVMGAFIFINSEINAFDSDDVTLISALGAQTALAIVNAELYETTLELATSDPLTGVMNRRAMVRQIEYELARAQRFGTAMALLLVDVDHFKAYNDRMGHVLGDEALRSIAKVLRESIRKVDSLARFGGEEFCVILPQANEKAVREVAAKLCQAVRGLRLRGVEKQELGYLSISIGITIVSGGAKELETEDAVTEIVAAADQALYDAKRLGRDRFIINEASWV
jgi:diguanylate cyclase (GGDEF)-like protein